MQFLSFFINFLALFQACVLAVPSSMQRRAADLQISLRQTQPNTASWHFALVTHAPDSTSGVKAVAEHVIDTANKCFDFQERNAKVNPAQLVVTGTLVAAQGEADDDALNNAVQSIISKVPAASQTEVLSGNFMNCFAFTVVAIKKLAAQGYVSPADAQLFVQFFDDNSAAVAAATDAGTIARCTRDDSDTPCALPGVDSSSVAPSSAASSTESTSSSTATPSPDVPPVVPPVPPGVPPAPPGVPPEATPPAVPPIVPPVANSSSTVQSTLFSTVETTSTVLPSTLFSTVETTSTIVPSTLFSTVQTTSTVV